MRLVLKALLGTVLALVTLLLLVFLLLGSEGFNRWLFNKAQVLEPRLELAFVGGDLWRQKPTSRSACLSLACR